MADEINRIIQSIEDHGAMSARELVQSIAKDRTERRNVQRALQTAFDKGLVKLDKNMRLVVQSSADGARHAA